MPVLRENPNVRLRLEVAAESPKAPALPEPLGPFCKMSRFAVPAERMSLRELRGVSCPQGHPPHMLGSVPGPGQDRGQWVGTGRKAAPLRGGARLARGPQRQPPTRGPLPGPFGVADLSSQPHSGPARPRPLPTARGRPARPSRSYKSRLRARGPGHSEQLRRGDCTARPAGPAPTGARCLQQPQHRDIRPRSGYDCALGLSAQVGAPGTPRRGGAAGHREGERGGRCSAWARRFG